MGGGGGGGELVGRGTEVGKGETSVEMSRKMAFYHPG